MNDPILRHEELTCIYTGRLLTPGTKKEHVLQNFTGATWTSDAISCNSVQDKFGEECDREMEKSFRYVRNLIGATGDRHTTPQGSELTSEDGHRYLMRGGEIILREPIIGDIETVDANTLKIAVAVSKKKDLAWARHMISKQLPAGWKFQSEELSHEKVDTSKSEMLSSRIVFGGDSCLKGVVKSCFNLLGVNNHPVAVSDCFNPLRTLLVDDSGSVNQFCRICKTQQLLKLERWGNFDHLLFVYSLGRGVYGFARLYGQFMFAMRLSDSYHGRSFRYGYHVDPFERHDSDVERNPAFKIRDLPKFDDQPMGMSRNVHTAIRYAFDRLIRDYYSKPFDDGLKAAIKTVFDRHQGEEYVSEAMMREVVDEVMKFVHPYIVAAAEKRRSDAADSILANMRV